MLEIDFGKLASQANEDGEFQLSARYWTSAVTIAIDDHAAKLTVIDGQIAGVETAASSSSATDGIELRATTEAWEKILSQSPQPGWVGIAHVHDLQYAGDPLERAAYHGALRRLVQLMRDQLHGAIEEAWAPEVSRTVDAIVGRYVYLDIEGIQYRVYYEESGNPDGIPLLMQHTAGSDARQWQHVLNDADYQQDYRLIAYDLPFHGRSTPPARLQWWKHQYRPTKPWLFGFIDSLRGALDISRPVFMGCSIGGLMAPVLARERAHEYRAVIGVNAGVLRDSGSPPVAREMTHLVNLFDVYHHPRVGNDWKASGVLDLMAPASPTETQRETSWIYGSGAPPVFLGDIISYCMDFNLSESEAREIDTNVIPVFLLSGEYDPLTIDGGSALLASWIAGSKYEVIPTAGHFAPSDNPGKFKEALDPALKYIAARESRTRDEGEFS